MSGYISNNFTWSEVERASGGRSLTGDIRGNAVAVVTELLQPTRTATGPILLTSLWRPGGSGSCHRLALAADFLPLRADGSRYTDPRALVDRMEDVVAWMTANLRGRFGELILEPHVVSDGREGLTVGDSTGAHIHVALAPCGGDGEVLRQRADGGFDAIQPGAFKNLARAFERAGETGGLAAVGLGALLVFASTRRK